MNGTETQKTPLMAFTTDFLRGKPDATFQEVKAAGQAAGFQVAPINYGNARRGLGMAAKARVSTNPRRRRLRQTDEPAATAAPSVTVDSGRRRGRKRKLDFSNLSNLVGELQDVVAERDRLLAALDDIARIIRSV